MEPRRTILLVDDNQTHRYALSRHLEESGFTVVCAESGSAAFEAIDTHKPDAILLDINLPDMTGFDICKQLKTDKGTQGIPVIFHSATHDTATARSYASDLGAASFLSYPIHIEHLVSVLWGAIAHARKIELPCTNL